MLKYLNGNKNNFIKRLDNILDQRRIKATFKSTKVKKIIGDVKKNGDKAVLKYEKKFLKTKKINIKNFKFSNSEIKNSIKKLNSETKKSINLAFNRIYKFHKRQKFQSYVLKDRYKNNLSYTSSPISRVGVYVPGGTASYPSSVLMNCIPALIAGVKEIYMTTPALNQKYNSAVLYAAKKCKIKNIYKIGGAQAIAALAFGTKSIKKVDKIVGPGNEYVALAKKEVYGESNPHDVAEHYFQKINEIVDETRSG